MTVFYLKQGHRSSTSSNMLAAEKPDSSQLMSDDAANHAWTIAEGVVPAPQVSSKLLQDTNGSNIFDFKFSRPCPRDLVKTQRTQKCPKKMRGGVTHR